ncbi:pyridoxamine 5'-phosphate oxidase family protein [Actinocorallia longicatena]|uniref:PPOX class F420-dependent oxidoreductase n=1 Tax=Actinocorallia longicatena TaxID=111803 RepID=A0ABP6PZ60_9ACTN
MKAPTQADLWEVLAARREGVLATIGENGLPHLSNVYYAADPARSLLRISTTIRRIKGRNLLRDPRAVLHVPGADFFTFSVAEGHVTTSVAKTPGDAATDDLHDLHTLLDAAGDRPAFDQKMIRHGRMAVHLTVTRLYGQIFTGR